MASAAVPAPSGASPTSPQGPHLNCATERASIASTGQQANDHSYVEAVSPDGRCVAFQSYATNLVPGDTNGVADVFVRDLETAQTELVSLHDGGGLSGAHTNCRSLSLSLGGRFVAFDTHAQLHPDDLNFYQDVYLRDRSTQATILVSIDYQTNQGAGVCYYPSLSADGRYVAFFALGSLVPGDTNGRYDVFVRDVVTGTTLLASLSSSGVQGNGDSGGHTLFPLKEIVTVYGIDVSEAGQHVAFGSLASNFAPNDFNGQADVFLRDIAAGTTELISADGAGLPGNGWSEICSVSADGRRVAFTSTASNLVPGDTNGFFDVFVRDRSTQTTVRTSVASNGLKGNGDSFEPQLAGPGRFVAFLSAANNLVQGDTNGRSDVFLHDLATGVTLRRNVAWNGTQTYTETWSPSISADGRIVTFSSPSALVPGDTNNRSDVFVKDCFTTNYCTAKANSLGCIPAIGSAGEPSLHSGEGFSVAGTLFRNGQTGILFYGVSGRAAAPFQGGTLCVAPPVLRTQPLPSGGSPFPAVDCTGTLRLDMNAFAAGGGGGTPDPSLRIPGTLVACQWWCYDPGHAPPDKSSLTGGLEYTVLP